MKLSAGKQIPIDGGETGALIRHHDWITAPIGLPRQWPVALHNALDLMLNSLECMYLVWGPELTFFYNDAYRPILGPRLNDALGQSLPTLLGEDWKSVQGAIDEALIGRPSHFKDVPSTIIRCDIKEETWWTYSFSPVRDDGGDIAGVLCITQETTGNVKATLALMDSEQRLDALIRSSSEVRFQISADWSQLHQLAGGNFIPDTQTDNSGWLEEYIPAGAREAVRAEFERAIRTRTTYHIEHPVNRVDGTVGWAHVRAVPLIDANDVITGWLGAASDISDRKCAEAALRDSEAQLRTLNAKLEELVTERTGKLQLFRDVIEANAVPTCVFDNDFRQVAFNSAHYEAFQHLYGLHLKGDEVLPDLIPPDQAASLRAHMARALNGETFRVAAEIGDPALVRRSYEFAYTPLRESSGRVIGAFYFAHDITRQIKSQMELEAAQSALRQAQKLEAVGQLTGGVAHDFNNLLTVIRSSSDLLKRPDLSQERRMQYATAISNTVDRASRLTGQLLAFARRQTLKPEVFAACDSVRALKDMLETLSGSKVTILTDLPEKSCFIFADSSQFDTALVNMALNARDSMNGEGQIRICVEPADAIPAVGLHADVAGAYVVVSISDTGTGIPSDRLESIFEPFFTTKELGKGTGLGLSQVFGFAKQSGGEILVDSHVGAGTTFRLYLPRVATPKDRQRENPQPLIHLEPSHGTRILVVEDNPDVGAVCVNSLIELGFKPTLASSAEGALARLANGTETFDVVLTDVVMPGMNGIDLGKNIRKSHPLLPVVLTSGYSEVLAQQGSFGFELLRKPYSIEQLSAVLLKVVRGAHRAYD
ncbi:MAG: sensor hybrid histidine kinase [Pseudomonas sp.]|nr:sensor hybrid histidine kinase [Pseudomonas sp.]